MDAEWDRSEVDALVSVADAIGALGFVMPAMHGRPAAIEGSFHPSVGTLVSNPLPGARLRAGSGRPRRRRSVADPASLFYS
ncbi:MAG TPA: hypothetical protein VIL13_12450 [Longimicrobiales bacterium]